MNLKHIIMKTLNTKKSVVTIGSFLLLFLFFSNTVSAQEIKVKGIVKGKSLEQTDVLNGANIFLKGTKTGTTSNRKGEFTFPKKLKVGDVLIFSYLGFIKKRVKITSNSNNLTIVLDEDNNEMLGALNSNKRYSSKRSKQ